MINPICLRLAIASLCTVSLSFIGSTNAFADPLNTFGNSKDQDIFVDISTERIKSLPPEIIAALPPEVIATLPREITERVKMAVGARKVVDDWSDIGAALGLDTFDGIDHDRTPHMAVPDYNPRTPPGVHGFEPAFTEIDAAASKEKVNVTYSGPAADTYHVDGVYKAIFGRNATSAEKTLWVGKPQLKVWHEVFVQKGDINSVGGNKPIEVMHVDKGLFADAVTLKEIFYLPSGSVLDYIVPLKHANTWPNDYSGLLLHYKASGKFHVLWWSTGIGMDATQLSLVVGLYARAAGNTATPYGIDIGNKVYVMRRGLGTTVFAVQQDRLYQSITSMSASDVFHTQLDLGRFDPWSNGFSAGIKIAEGTLTPASGGTIPIVTVHNCFVAGTPVWTERGLVSIEDVRVGDKVLSTDEGTGESAYKPVLNTFINKASDTVRIRFKDSDDVIEATLEHPFRVMGYKATGWVEAGELRMGDLVLTKDGVGMVEDVEFVKKEVNTYNFEVADWHTYHVGQTGWLVHNTSSLGDLGQTWATGMYWSFIMRGVDGKIAGPANNQDQAKVLPQIAIMLGTTAGRLGLPVYNIARGFLQGLAGSGSTNPILGVGRIAASPSYVEASISQGFRYYAPTQWTLGHNLAFVFGHGIRHGTGSVRLVTNTPIAGSITASELSTAALAGYVRVGALPVTYSFMQNATVHSNLSTDPSFWYGSMPNPAYNFSDGQGFSIRGLGGGPRLYPYPNGYQISYTW